MAYLPCKLLEYTEDATKFSSVNGSRTMFLSVNPQDEVAPRALAVGDSDICKTLVEKRGYACEEHTVTTPDGFILHVQRIPEERSNGSATKKPPVLLQHGVLADAANWLLGPPEQSLAFLLADNGFDVWLANSRGTVPSRQHKSLSPDDPAFWNWSWDELVAYDLPATFQYVHDLTGQSLHYVGHSMGTLIALAAFSKHQLLNMLRAAVLLAPVAYTGHMTSPVARAAADIISANVSHWLAYPEFQPIGTAAIELFANICGTPGVDCSNFVTSFTGPNCCLNTSEISILFGHGGQSTSTKTLIHLSQMIKEGTIAMFNYKNEDENKKHYGQPTAPVYNLTNIPNEVPLFIGHGGADALSDVKDVQLLLDSLKEHDEDKLVLRYIKNYAHADLILGVNAKQVLYDPILSFLKTQ